MLPEGHPLKVFLDRVGYRADKQGATASIYAEDVYGLVQGVDAYVTECCATVRKAAELRERQVRTELEIARGLVRCLSLENDVLRAEAKMTKPKQQDPRDPNTFYGNFPP